MHANTHTALHKMYVINFYGVGIISIIVGSHSTYTALRDGGQERPKHVAINPLNPELNPICSLLALLAHHFLHISRVRVKSLTLRLLMSYIYGAPILDVSRSHTATHHSR